MLSFRLQLAIRELSVPWIEYMIIVESAAQPLYSRPPAFMFYFMISEQIHTEARSEALTEWSC